MNKGVYTYEYPRPSVTSDCVIFGYDAQGLSVLLIERGIEPFNGSWAFPASMNRAVQWKLGIPWWIHADG